MKAKIAAALCGLFAATTFAHADSGVVATYETSPEKLWALVDFHQPSENIMPPIASSERTGEGVGATKINALNGGGKVHLLLAHYDKKGMSFNYTIQESPLPVKNYLGVVEDSEAGNGKAQLAGRAHMHRTVCLRKRLTKSWAAFTLPLPARSVRLSSG